MVSFPTQGGILVSPSQMFTLPEGQDPVLVTFDLQESAFLSVGGAFTATIDGIGFQDRKLPFQFNIQ